MNDAPIPTNEPLLRTLSPALSELERRLRAWLKSTRRFPLSTLQTATLEGLAADLQRQSEALQLDRPLLTVMLMGGTGVGKSTLLNALAGGPIAQASFARPTTRDPVVYYHESLTPQRLDPALRLCRLAVHDRAGLEQKIIVDTPDLDSNDLANRDKLFQLLPVADIVLYVGSQEKYHDKLGWELFLQQRKRRAFAFVLNKWDRCQNAAAGLRPDHDLLRDLESEGFKNPLIFRTCAQHWVDHPWHNNGAAAPPVEGEQFLDLVRWLELGLNRLEIEAIKARGVSQLLQHFQEALTNVCPPDLTAAADKTKHAWQKSFDDEAQGVAAILLNTLEPYQKEIEHHFAMGRQRHFRGLMATYLYWFNRLRYAGSTLRDQIPFLPRLGLPVETPREWDLASFTRACSTAAADKHLDARTRALADKLLIEASNQGIAINLMSEATEAAVRLDWRAHNAQAMIDVLGQLEQACITPRGGKRVLQAVIIFLADWLPLAAFFTMLVLLLWQYTMEHRPFYLTDFLLPLVVMIMVVVILHLLIALVLPLRWQAIRGDFERMLRDHIRADLENSYAHIPAAVATTLLAERRQVEHLQGEIREVAGWLSQREQSAQIAGLYGK